MYFTKRHKILIDQLQELCPIAFPKKPDPKVPLAHSQHKKIQKLLDVSWETADTLLYFWCQGKRYDVACSTQYSPRYLCNGKVNGYVTALEADYHSDRLEQYYRSRAVGEAKYHKGSLVDYYRDKFPASSEVPKKHSWFQRLMSDIPMLTKEVKEQ